MSVRLKSRDTVIEPRRRQIAWFRPLCRWLAAGFMLAIVPLTYFFGATVIRFAANEGQVVIVTDEPDIEVTIKNGTGIIVDRDRNREYTVRAGTEYDVEVTV